MACLKYPLGLTFVVSLFVILGFVYLSHATSLPFSFFSKDMAYIGRIKSYIGLLSNFGITIWAATCGVCILMLKVIRRKKLSNKIYAFYLYSALLTFILLFDDMVMIHDRLLQVYFHLSQNRMYLFYIIVCFVYLCLFYEILLSSHSLLFILSMTFLALSMAADCFIVGTELQNFFEDSLKFLGISFWFVFFLYSANYHITREFH